MTFALGVDIACKLQSLSRDSKHSMKRMLPSDFHQKGVGQQAKSSTYISSLFFARFVLKSEWMMKKKTFFQFSSTVFKLFHRATYTL